MTRLVLGPDRHGSCALFEGTRLAWLGVGEPPGAHGAERLTCPEAELAPGRVNAHTHLYSGLVPFGVPLPAPWPDTFVAILERLWWRLDRALDAETLKASARVAIGEALLAGTTTLVDHHESPSSIAGSLEVLAEAAEALGVRALLCYGATERNGGEAEADAGLAESARAAKALAGHPTLRGLVGLHAGFTVSDRTIARAARLAGELGVGLHVHVAEDRADVEDARRRGYLGALQRLDANGALGPGTIAAHGIHLSREEIEIANRHAVFFVQNPRSNLGNGVGYPAGLVAANRVALGTDGYPAKMEDELAVARAEGARFGEPRELSAARLERGVELARRHFGEPLHDVVAMGPEGARHVVVAGRVVVRDGRLAGADLETLQTEAREAARRLSARMLAPDGAGQGPT